MTDETTMLYSRDEIRKMLLHVLRDTALFYEGLERSNGSLFQYQQASESIRHLQDTLFAIWDDYCFQDDEAEAEEKQRQRQQQQQDLVDMTDPAVIAAGTDL